MKKDVLVFDIGGTKLKYALMSVTGEIIEKNHVDTPCNDLDQFMQKIYQICDYYQQRYVKIAVSAPGKIDIHTQTIHFGGTLPFLDGANMQTLIGDHYHVPVQVENDGKCAALAEYWLGNLRDVHNGVALVLGTGVGGGIIINDHLLHGSHFQAGEVSFMNSNAHALDFNHAYGACGSAVQMIKQINRHTNQTDLEDGRTAFKLITNHDVTATTIFHEYCLVIASLILNIQTVVDVQKYVIGGGISAQPCVVPQINHAYDQMLRQNQFAKNTLARPLITCAKFENDANLYGALYASQND